MRSAPAPSAPRSTASGRETHGSRDVRIGASSAVRSASRSSPSASLTERPSTISARRSAEAVAIAQASPWKRTVSTSRSGAEAKLDPEAIAAERVDVLVDRVGPGQLPEVPRVPEALEDHAAVERGRHASTLEP